MIQPLHGIAATPYHPIKAVRDRLYRQFITTFPCCACGQSWWIDPAHTGPHAYSRKASDLLCIPLCRKCHDAFDKSPVKFAAKQHMDVQALIQMFQQFYRLRFPERHQETTPVEKQEAA